MTAIKDGAAVFILLPEYGGHNFMERMNGRTATAQKGSASWVGRGSPLPHGGSV